SRRIEVRRGTLARGLLGARTAIDNRTDELEMARVRRQRDVDGAAIGSAERTLGAVMVLNVTGAAVGSHHPLETRATLELGEDRLVRATHHVSERVESTTMRHSQHRVAHAALRCELEREVEHRHHHVEALDAEPLRTEIRLAEETLEAFDLGE